MFSFGDKGSRIRVDESHSAGSHRLARPQVFEGPFGSDHRHPESGDKEADATIARFARRPSGGQTVTDNFAARNSGPLSGGFADIRNTPGRPKGINLDRNGRRK